ncbi:MAG TPA: 23S rRNA (guanosine(2251)-2'-O)-methyltransferase RlmB [Acidimicrobiales bacterium]|nr:23S rRNA (guanosine(2251)-2'-O)-methyltransferase RlmB [Acidimicrobiales bacterium]
MTPRPAKGRGRDAELGGEQVEGRRAVLELLRAGRRPVRELWMAEGLDPSDLLTEIAERARAARVPVREVGRARLETMAQTEAPQGVLAQAGPIDDVDLDELCRPGKGGVRPFLVALDGVTDPHNLGAILRSAEVAGATGIVLPSRRSAHLTPTVAKAAAGAIEHLRFALVPGLPAALSRLKAAGVWTVGLDGEARTSLHDLELATEPLALVLGSEGKGLGRLTAERCDVLVAIPRHGSIGSLNVGAAAAVSCFEVARRRSSA